MELDDINLVEPSGEHETIFYENTKITSATLERTEISQPEQTEKDEGLYEQLRLERKSNERNTLTSLEKETIKRIICFIYIILALVIALYIGIIALTIVVAVQKEQNGGWSNWEAWSTCSDSCGEGIKSRNRFCSNPKPSLYGKQCIGNSEKVNQCNKQLCPGTDGGWSNWETWSTCSDSCGGGIKSRNRSCSNPEPSLYGKQCIGNSEQVSQCNKQLCPGTDGGWSNWETWSTCSDSCGGRIKSRNRSCSNPTPSLYGKQCIGNFEQVSLCNKQLCPGTEHNVAFTAFHLNRNSSSSSILLFDYTYTNIGDGYDKTTGKFKCNIPGVYHFVVTLTKVYLAIKKITAKLIINGSSKLFLYVRLEAVGGNGIGNYMMTGAGTFHLNQNDVVYVYGVPDYFTNDRYSYFTGFLITPDQ